MKTYSFPSDTAIMEIYRKKNDAILFDTYYYKHINYKKICDNADIEYYKDCILTIDIDLLCNMEEYLKNRLEIFKYDKIYIYDYEDNKWKYHYSYNVQDTIIKIKECLLFIKKNK